MPTSALRPATWPRYPDAAVIVLRIFLGAVLVYGTQDNVFSTTRMHEFRDFLERNGFPWPLLCAYLSVYTQFLAGLAILVGMATRVAAALMVINFLIALAMVHLRLPFDANIAPFAMLAASLFFLLHGPDRYTLDARWSRRAEPVPPSTP